MKMNLPNKLTVLRMILIPFFMIVIMFPVFGDVWSRIIAALLFGLAAGFVYSVTQLLLGIGNVAYVPSVSGIILCILFDYIVAFTLLGLAGIFNRFKLKPIVSVICGILFVCILRYISHILSGAVVWYEITKLGGWNDYVQTVGMWTYSLVYNIKFMLPETIITLVAAPVCLRVLKLVKK